MTDRPASLATRLALWGIAGAALWVASSAALQQPPGPGGIDVLELARALQRERAVSLEGFATGHQRRLRAAWSQRGIGETTSERAPRVVFLAPDDPLALSLLSRTELGRTRAAPDVDLTRDVVTITCEDPGRPGIASTFVIGTEGTATVAAAVEALARALPPTRPALTARTAEGLRIEREMTPIIGPGRPKLRMTRRLDDTAFERTTAALTGTVLAIESGCTPDMLEVARHVDVAVAKVYGETQAAASQKVAEIRIVRTVDARSVDGAVDSVAWFEPHARRLVGIAGVHGLESELVRAYASWLAIDRGGEPDVRSGDGLSGQVTEGGPRALPFAVAVRLAGAPSRTTTLGTWRCLVQLERIAALGFGAVVLDVRIPLGPPASPEAGARQRQTLAVASWGRGVTLDGDGAVLATAAHAERLGLDVVLWPRFVAGPNGPLVTQQVHPSGPAIEVLAGRYARAVAGVARLAERAGAHALVLLEPDLLPLPGNADPAVRAARRSLRRQAIASAGPFQGELIAFGNGVPSLERAAAVADLTPVAGSPARVSFGFEIGLLGETVGNPAAAYKHRLEVAAAAAEGRLRCVEIRLDGDDAERRNALLLACATAVDELPAIELIVLSYWGLDHFDLQRASVDELRVTRDVRVVPGDVLLELSSVRR